MRRPDPLDFALLAFFVLLIVASFATCARNIEKVEGCNCGGLHDFLSQDEVLDLADDYEDWLPYEVDAVIYCESRRDRFAYNPRGFYGLGQVSARWHSWRVTHLQELYEAETAIRIMHDIYVEAGRTFKPWPVCGKL